MYLYIQLKRKISESSYTTKEWPLGPLYPKGLAQAIQLASEKCEHTFPPPKFRAWGEERVLFVYLFV